MAMIQRLPYSFVGNAHQLMKVLNQFGGMSVSSSFGSAPTLMPKPSASETNESEDNDQLVQRAWPGVVERMFAEGVKGVSAEALLLLQKVDNGAGWDDWGDYDTLIARLVEGLRAADRGLRVEIFYAEKDWMIGNAGTKGPAWFDECWKTLGAGVVTHHSSVVTGADHDSVWDLQWGATQKLFEGIHADQ